MHDADEAGPANWRTSEERISAYPVVGGDDSIGSQ